MNPHLEVFFSKNQNHLEQSYPGINFNIFNYHFRNLSLSSFLNCIDDLKSGKPLEYITGSAYFYKSDFHVNTNVLIPRFETEVLVEKALELIKKNKLTSIIDIGCGSGIIGLSVLAELSVPVKMVLSDISNDALKVAKQNYLKLKYKFDSESHVSIVKQDRLENYTNEEFDLILSNPPYIKQHSDRSLVHKRVLEYEPHIALFIDDESYDLWYKRFFEQIQSCLKPFGFFIIEGHEDHLDHLKEIAAKNQFVDLKVDRDLTKSKRFLIGRKK